jgi:hypothetical protein
MATAYQNKIHHRIQQEAAKMMEAHASGAKVKLTEYVELVALYHYAYAERMRSDARRQQVGPGFNYQGKRYGWRMVALAGGTRRLQVLDWRSWRVLIDGSKGVSDDQPASA